MRVIYVLNVVTIVCAVCGIFTEHTVSAEYWNGTTTSQMTESSTAPTSGNGSDSNMFLVRGEDGSWTIEYGEMPPEIVFVDWEVLERYFSTLLNYSSLPDDDETKQFIMSYPSELQRQIVATQLSYCPMTPLCSHSLNVSEWAADWGSCCKPCNCNANCTEFDDCCLDVLTNFLRQDDVIDEGTKSCIPLNLDTEKVYTNYKYSTYAVAHCPVASKHQDRDKCEQDYTVSGITMEDVTPVWHNSSRTIYRNKHCALCNGARSSEMNVFMARVGCYGGIPDTIQNESDLIHFAKAGLGCDIGFGTEDFEPEYCEWGISKCNVTGLWTTYDVFYEHACQLYTSLIKIPGHMSFKNVFCALCNGYTDIAKRCYKNHFNPSTPFSFSGLLSMGGGADQYSSATDRKCSSGFVYHTISDECVAARCSPLRRLQGNSCLPFISMVEKLSYDVVLRLSPSRTYSIADAYVLAVPVVHEVKEFINHTLVGNQYEFTICSASIMLKSTTSCSGVDNPGILVQRLAYFLLKLSFTISVSHNPESIVSNLTGKVSLDISTITGTENEQLDINIAQGYTSDFPEGNIDFVLLDNNTELNSICSSLDDRVLVPCATPWSVIYFCFSDEQPRRQSRPVMSMLACPMINVTPDTYPWVITDDGVLFIESGHVFNNSQFYLSGQNESDLFLCKEQYFQLPYKTDTRRWTLSVEHIVSITCVSLSIVFLLVTLIVFFVLSKMRTLPGKNNMALVSALLLAQALYLVSSFSGFEQGSVVCKLVGILTHFCWLLVAFWMNVCTFHMFRVLTKTKAMRRRSGNTRYASYHLYCITASALCVGINVLVSSVTSGYDDMGYGLDSCYISSPKMLLYTFGIPLALIIVSNLGMFLVVIVTIKKSSAIQKNSQNERNDIAIFARLSSLTGATWIFGFIYTWTQWLPFSYIFIILNAGQGVFLFLSLICTSRVRTMAGQKYSMTFGPTPTSSMRNRSTFSTDAAE